MFTDRGVAPGVTQHTPLRCSFILTPNTAAVTAAHQAPKKKKKKRDLLKVRAGLDAWTRDEGKIKRGLDSTWRVPGRVLRGGDQRPGL